MNNNPVKDIKQITNHKKNKLFINSLLHLGRDQAIKTITKAGLEYVETTCLNFSEEVRLPKTICLLIKDDKVIKAKYCF